MIPTFKFQIGQPVRHLETGRIYHIIKTPATLMVKTTTICYPYSWEPAYCYVDRSRPLYREFVREQKDMEETFVVHNLGD